MKKIIARISALSLAVIFGLVFVTLGNAYADEEGASTGTSISLTPVSKILQISSNSTYDSNFEVKNDGGSPIRVEVYAAPYSYVYSDEEDTYKLGFNNENNFTQISRWITFRNNDGDYVDKTVFSIDAHNALTVNYRISTPNNIPAGGQYAVIFAHTLSEASSAGGIRTEASPGLIVYGRSTEGETVTSAEISNMKIEQSVTENGATRNNFYASAKVKNNGNVDFTATGKLTVQSIIGGGDFEIADSRISIIPEAELLIANELKDTPSFGIYNVTWTVEAGETSETISKTIFLIPVWLVILTILLLTILTIWIIMVLRKRKERRSRLAI
ncbi:hypothetical protein J6S37_01815 [Candidatus Saccharibacteria bacterium]|nr:hypothetical protein [Candidatus Saccharibacteria bacterium]